jgi:hypothetical protein
MSIDSPKSHKLITLLTTTAVLVVIGWFVFPLLRREGPTVTLVDSREEVAKLMSERILDDPSTLPEVEEGYPPPLVREPLDEETATLFFPGIGTSMVYEPHAFIHRTVNTKARKVRFAEHPTGSFTIKTNEYGMREDEPVREQKPDLRILVTGDSHTDGVCDNAESFPNVVETLLAAQMGNDTVEVLNAGTGSFNLFNYLGTFERLVELDSDVFVVAVYGGNDFSGAMYLQRYFERREPYKQRRFTWGSSKVDKSLVSLGPQEVIQEVYFLNHPEDVDVAVDLACSISVELERQCALANAQLVFLYLPPPGRGQPQHFTEELHTVAAGCKLPTEEFGVSDRIADKWLEFLELRSIPCIDLRPHFRESEELFYWRTDHHLNVAGHRRAAELVHDRVTELLNL